MMRFYSVPSLFVLWFAVANAVGQEPSVPPLAAFDEATLRRAGLPTDVAGLLNLLREHTRDDGDAKQIQGLIAQLASPHFEQRDSAAKELTAIGRSALVALRQARKDHADPEVRLRAKHCLADIERQLDANMAMAAVRRLIHLRADGAAGQLLELLPVVDWEIQDEIFHGLPKLALHDGKLDPALLAALDDPSPLRRSAAALAVALNGGDDEHKRVRRLLTDKDADVRLRAAQGLLARRDAASLPVLIALLNEPMVDVSWPAEELLHWVAGDKSPKEKVGAASAAERRQAVDAWKAWHKLHAAKIDWEEIDQAPRRPGLYFVCTYDDAVWVGGCDGLRWTLPGWKEGARDALLLPGNQVCVLSYLLNNNELVKCALDGKAAWRQPLENGYVMCQRLPNEHFLLANWTGTLEVTTAGNKGASVSFSTMIMGLEDAWQPRTGPLVCLTPHAVVAVDRFTGCFSRSTYFGGGGGKFAVLPDGRCVLPHYIKDRLLETTASGQKLELMSIRDPHGVVALRNGNHLVDCASCFDLPKKDPFYRILELDPAGRTVWETYAPQKVERVRSVLDRVRIGFDKLRPAVTNLDTVAHRVGDFHNPDWKVRARSVNFLISHTVTNPACIPALIPVLDDENENVRNLTACALAQIGAPAVPALIETLLLGTANSRVGALHALGSIGEEARDSLPQIMKLLIDPSMPVELRCSAARTLPSIGPQAKAAVPLLLDCLKAEHDDLRVAAAYSLWRIAPNEPAVFNGLIAALLEPKYPEGQSAACHILSRLGPKAKAALPILLNTANSAKVDLPTRILAGKLLGCLEQEAKPAVASMMELLDDMKQPADLRVTLVNSLVAIGETGKPAHPLFLALLKDTKQPASLRAQLVNSLVSLGEAGKPAHPLFLQLLQEPNLSDELSAALVASLTVMGQEGRLKMEQLAIKGDKRMRLLAINQLRYFGWAAHAALHNATKDPNQEISERASASIIWIRLNHQLPEPAPAY